MGASARLLKEENIKREGDLSALRKKLDITEAKVVRLEQELLS